MATHSSVLAWRIPGTGELGGLPSMGSNRVRHNWSNLAAAAAAAASKTLCPSRVTVGSGLQHSDWGWGSTIQSIKVGLTCSLSSDGSNILKIKYINWPRSSGPDPSLLGIHTEETRRERDMFIAALFMIARTWKQPRCPSADEWIRKQWYIYTMEYYSAIKKNTFESVLMRWMKLEPIMQSEVSQKEKHQYSILTHIYGI